MSELQTTRDVALERANIIQNTPDGQDPVVYWHQVAVDAIRTSEKDRERTKNADRERDDAKHDRDAMIRSLIDKAARHKDNAPLDLSNLIRMAQDGDISLNISLYLSRGDCGTEVHTRDD